jgi:organic radical activating enzyme
MENKEIKGIIHSIESFVSVDGPGVRYIVFLQGCRMRCRYCHNPDTWALNDKNSYEETPAETLKKAMRFKAYWKETGGITVSGGEALLQIDYVTELFRLAKEQGVHTTLDTSGNPFTREEPLDVVHIHHGVLHRTHRNREGAAGKLCHRQMLFAAGFHGVGEQLLHLFAAADQRNACVVDGGDQVATVLTDIKLCLHIQILHRNVVSVFYGYMITFPSYVFCDRVT